MTQEDLLKRYTNHNDQVQEYMKMLSDSLMQKYQEIPDTFVISLDVLAGNLVIMTKAIDNIIKDKDGIVGQDNYRGEKKSTSLSAFLATQHNVLKILNTFGWTPMGKSKIKENADASDVQKYLEQLVS